MQAICTLHQNAAKFAIINEPGESVRFYERLFAIWRALTEFQQNNPQKAQSNSSSTTALRQALQEYITLLARLERHERAALIREAIEQFSAAEANGQK